MIDLFYLGRLPVTENSLEPKSVIKVLIAVRCERFYEGRFK